MTPFYAKVVWWIVVVLEDMYTPLIPSGGTRYYVETWLKIDIHAIDSC